MESHPVTRRHLLQSTLAAGTAAALGTSLALAAEQPATPTPQTGSSEGTSAAQPFRYCFNTATIRKQKVPLDKTVEIVAKAGYTAIEPWLDEIRRYQAEGGKLPDLKKKIADLGLTVESAIGFAPWIVDNDAERKKGLETAKADMELVKAIGGKRIAAPPVGATKQTDLSLSAAAERFAALVDVGESIGVLPQVELWGFSTSLHLIGEVLYVAAESRRKNAMVLTDVYHIYKGGSDFSGLRILSPQASHVLHVNDYPADPPRATINDSHRVYPGDGVAPLGQIFRDLRDGGFRGFLSLELFNPTYYEQDPALVARTGFEKTKAAVEKGLG